MLNNIIVLLPLIISLVFAGIVYGAIFITIQRYKQTTYFKDTKIPYTSMRKDIGRYGEYLTYICLRNYENDGAKFLFNVYLPRENGETTEIDVLMIQKSGLYVFESKNYSGWIFGSENDKNWTQTLPRGRRARKERFFNPVMQNKLHIKWLKNLVGEEMPIHSVVVFSERCTLKSINIKDDSVKIIKRNKVSATIDQISQATVQTLSDNAIKEIYDKLYPYTQVTDEQKRQHISNIESHINAVHSSESPDKAASSEKALPNGETAAANETATPICPRCGSPLVLRTSKKGDKKGQNFYGCSSFPKCRYIRNIDTPET